MEQSNDPSPTRVYLHAIETTVPEKWYSQDFAQNFFLNIEGVGDKQKRFLKKIYSGSGIEKRHTVIDDYDKEPENFTFFPPNKRLQPEPSTSKRNDLFIGEANRLSRKAGAALFNTLPAVDPSTITHLITVSCTGFSAPGFDFHLLKHLALSPSTRRYHIGFMGCYAALTALDLARTICRSDSEARVLMVNVELCSLHLQQKQDLDTLVANAIFSDGVSAAFISADENDSSGPRFTLESFNSQYLEDSEEEMAWKVGDTGFDMKLSAYVPKLIHRHIHEVLEALLSREELSREDIDIWAVHPGGKAILQKVEQALDLPSDALAVSYDILREFGNMSSTTIMFVLQKILREERQGNVFALAFGPGLTVETGLLRKIG